MTSQLPASFLQRISTYPDKVQDLLKTELNEDIARDVLGVLHGASSLDDKKIKDLTAKPVLTDAFIGRMLLSKKFQLRLSRLPRVLQSEETAQQRSLVTDFVTPLGDPERPYLHKLHEILAASENPALIEDLRVLMALIDMQQRAADYPADARQIAIREILLAGTEAATPLLPCLVQAIGGPAEFHGARPLPRKLPRPAGTAFVNALYGADGPPRLTGTDVEVLNNVLRGCADSTGALPLGPARPLGIALRGTPEGDAAPHWDALRDSGLVADIRIRPESWPENGEGADAEGRSADGPVLTLPADFPLPALLVACLRVLDTGGRAVDLFVVDDLHAASWATEITGYSDRTHDRDIGHLRDGAATRHPALRIRAVSLLRRTGRSQTDAARRMRPEDCFAILVTRDAGADPDLYLNADHCLLIDGLDALAERFAQAPAAVRQKPVVLLGAQSPTDPEYLINAVQSYWSYAGRYPVSPVAIDYDGETSQFQLGAATETSLSHIALIDQTVMPLPLALALAERGTDGAAGLEAGLLLLPETPIVQDAGRLPADDAALAALDRSLNAAGFGPGLHEAAFLIGTVDYRALADKMAVAHWPIAPVVRHIVGLGTRLEASLRKFDVSPTPALANRILQMLARTGDLLPLREAIDRFAIRLSMHPETILEMDTAPVEDFLPLARQIPSMDRVATNLMVLTGKLCHANRGYILPLFELLACSLSAEALQAALAFAAADLTGKPRRLQYRVGECIRRYGTVEIMIQHLALLHRSDPELLTEPGFMRFYQRALTNEALPALRATVGGKVIETIAETLDFKDSFKQALVGRERDALVAMMQDPERTQDVNFIDWMDSLRSHSNELCDMALPINGAAFPQLSNVYGNKLMATVFSDLPALQSMNEAGLFEDGADLSLIAKNILRDNGPLNAMLAARFEGSAAAPLSIDGDSAGEVFARAAEATRGREARHDNGPKVSVVISAFNADLALFRLSLASMLNQTHANVEIFVIDDASEPDNSAALKAEVDAADGDVQYRRLDRNSGPYVGRNLAIGLATGDFIAIQDADDWSHPDRFAQQLAAFADSPTTQLVTTPHIRIDKYGRVQMEAGFSILGDGPMTSMFRRSAFDKVGVFAEVRSRGDVEMRERMRSYFGNHTLCEIALPMMLCFADSATLSQKTKAEKHEFLQLFRSNISSRGSLRNLRRSDAALGPRDAIAVPLPLRPTSQGV